MIEFPGIQQSVIRNHYNIATLFYRLLWGPHVHHGFWESDESPRKAQLQLTERLADLAQIAPGSKILDVGCGMGGSSRWLASELGCHVTGVTISAVQQRWASAASRLQRINPKPVFQCEDVETIRLPRNSLDLVWSIECTEHLFRKREFFMQAATWLRPSGKFAICARLAGANELAPNTIEQVQQVCEGMFCPSLGTQKDYEQWFVDAGMEVQVSQLWTEKVLKTWEICLQRVDRSGVRLIARLLGQNHTLFLNRFTSILDAYRSNAMEYGCFVAVKESKN